MNYNNIYIAILSSVSCLGLVYLLFFRYKALRIDAFRQDIFDLRDELFDYASKGNIDFNDPAYGMLRSTMNGFIRFGHKLSLWQIIIFILISGDKHYAIKPTFRQRWEKATSQLDPDVKDKLNFLLSKMHHYIFNHIIINSPEIILTILPPIIFYFFGKSLLQKLRDILMPSVDVLDSAAFNYGKN